MQACMIDFRYEEQFLRCGMEPDILRNMMVFTNWRIFTHSNHPQLHELVKCINTLERKLKNYNGNKYAFNRKIVNLFYQQFIYNLGHNYNEIELGVLEPLFKKIISNLDNFDWKDQKTGYTVLLSLAKCNLPDCIDHLNAHAKNTHLKKQMIQLLLEGDDDGINPLISASRQGNEKVAEKLLKIAKESMTPGQFSAYLFERDRYGFNAFVSAARKGSIEVLEKLLTYAKKSLSPREVIACLTETESYGYDPLNTAAKEGHWLFVDKLLHVAKHRMEPLTFSSYFFTTNLFGFNPLMSAAKEANFQVVEKILECAKDNLDAGTFKKLLQAEDNFFNNVLSLSIKSGKADVVERLLDTAKASMHPDEFIHFIKQKNYLNTNALIWSVRTGNLQGMEIILGVSNAVMKTEDLREFIGQKDSLGRNAWMIAIGTGHGEMLSKLFEFSVNRFSYADVVCMMKSKLKSGDGILGLAVKHGNLKDFHTIINIAQKFLTKADYYAFSRGGDDQGDTLLLSAAVAYLRHAQQKDTDKIAAYLEMIDTLLQIPYIDL